MGDQIKLTIQWNPEVSYFLLSYSVHICALVVKYPRNKFQQWILLPDESRGQDIPKANRNFLWQESLY